MSGGIEICNNATIATHIALNFISPIHFYNNLPPQACITYDWATWMSLGIQVRDAIPGQAFTRWMIVWPVLVYGLLLLMVPTLVYHHRRRHHKAFPSKRVKILLVLTVVATCIITAQIISTGTSSEYYQTNCRRVVINGGTKLVSDRKRIVQLYHPLTTTDHGFYPCK